MKSKHKECKQRHDYALEAIVERATRSATGVLPLDRDTLMVSEDDRRAFVTDSEGRTALIRGFENAVDLMLDDHVISESEEQQLNSFAGVLDLDQTELNRSGAVARAQMGVALREVSEARIPQQTIIGDLPFNFQKSEKCAWVFQGVDFYEERSRRSFEGGSRGVNVRVAKGVYIRQSAFKGHSVVTTSMEHIDSGLLALTTKHLYFAGNRGSHRVPYAKIVSFHAHTDGLGIERDAATAKPRVYKLTDGWFAYNMARLLSDA